MPEKKNVEVFVGKKEGSEEAKEEVKGEKAPRKDEVGGRWHTERGECPYCGAINYVYTSDIRYVRFRCWNCDGIFFA